MSAATSRPVGWGLIGCGDIAAKRVAAALRGAPHSELVSVSRARAELLPAFAAEHGARRWQADWRELLKDPEIGAVYLAKMFRPIYLDPYLDLRLDILGKLLWIRLAVASMLRHRPDSSEGFGFLPTRREWMIGLRHFAMFLPLGVVLLYGLHSATFRLDPAYWWKSPLTFLGMLWGVTLWEEYFFRGILQSWLIGLAGKWSGLLLASALFGLVHLWFPPGFPNWKQAVLAGALGVFCGRAYMQARAVRASMVTHALVATIWRTLFA